MNFWRIFRLVWGKRWLILGIMAIAAFVILAGTTLKAQKRSYESVASIEPLEAALMQPTTPDAETGGGGNRTAERNDRIADLVMQLRTSNAVASKTAELLRQPEEERTRNVQDILERNGYFASYDSQIEAEIKRLQELKELTNKKEIEAYRIKREKEVRDQAVRELTMARDALGQYKPGGEEASMSDIIAKVRANVAFDIVRGPIDTETNPQIVTQIRLSGRFEREAEANLYLNMLCVAFIDYYTTKSAGAVNAQLAQYRERLNEAETALNTAKDARLRFFNSTGLTLTSTNGSALGQLGGLQANKAAAEQEYNQSLVALNTIRQEALTTQKLTQTDLPSEENPRYKTLVDRLQEVQNDITKLQSQGFLEAWPEMKKTRAQEAKLLKEIKALLAKPYALVAPNPRWSDLQGRESNAKIRFEEAKERLTSIDRQINSLQSELSRLPEVREKLTVLDQKVKVAEDEYTDVLRRYNRIKLRRIDEGKEGTINIVSPASAIPVGGDIAAQRGKLVVYGLILALICGVALVIGMDALDNSVRSVQQVEELLQLPVVGIIPEHLPDPVRAPRIAHLSPLSPIAESYRLLRTDLLFSAAEKPFQSLMTATGKPGQGATTTITNLAITLAQAGKRVILVDTDLRFPKLHAIFGLPNTLGLTNLLRGETNLEDVLQTTDVKNLVLLSAGPMVMNPSELLSSAPMRAYHEQLKKLADFVLFDTPSAIAFADASILASFVDLTLMVVRARNVPRGSEEQVLKLLEKARANVIGVVLNGVSSSEVDSVHFHYGYYPSISALGADPYSPYTNTSGNGTGPTDRPPLDIPTSGQERFLGSLPDNPRPLSEADAPVADDGSEKTLRMSAVTVMPPPPVSHATLVEAPRPKSRSAIPWKIIALVVGVGLALGALLLSVGGGVAVK